MRQYKENESPFYGWTGGVSTRGFDETRERVEPGSKDAEEWNVYVRAIYTPGWPDLDWYCATFATERDAEECARVLREAFELRKYYAESLDKGNRDE